MNRRQSFGNREWGLGVLVGYRAFHVFADGRLRALTRRVPWVPGENVAVHTGIAGPLPTPPDHQVASLDCTCGFYACFGGVPNDNWGGAEAIIEGYGVCAVGTRGFRAEKARVVAFAQPRWTKAHRSGAVPYIGDRPTFAWREWERTAEALTATYPDIPIFASLAEACDAFPLTKPADVMLDKTQA